MRLDIYIYIYNVRVKCSLYKAGCLDVLHIYTVYIYIYKTPVESISDREKINGSVILKL